jgi:hypothetical protein
MQLVVSQVAAIEVSTWASLEVARASVEDRAITTETAAATAATERDLLASNLALAEAEVERLRAAAASAEEAAERAKTAAATAREDVRAGE